MINTTPTSLNQALTPLNSTLTPLIKLGFGAPLNFAPGMVLLEVPGRVTGRLTTVPLVAYLAYPYVAIGTVRGNSQWVKNLHASSSPHVWVWGQRFELEKVVAGPQHFIGRITNAGQ